MRPDSVAELVAKTHNACLVEASKTYGLPCSDWEALPPEAKGAAIAAVGELLAQLGLLGLHVTMDGAGRIVGKVVAPAKPKVSKVPRPDPHGQWTGETCPTCGGTKMLRTGKCSTCQDCGTGSSCS